MKYYTIKPLVWKRRRMVNRHNARPCWDARTILGDIWVFKQWEDCGGEWMHAAADLPCIVGTSLEDVKAKAETAYQKRLRKALKETGLTPK